MSEILGIIEFNNRNNNKKKQPYYRLEGNYDALRLKMGVDIDELEKLIRRKKIRR